MEYSNSRVRTYIQYLHTENWAKYMYIRISQCKSSESKEDESIRNIYIASNVGDEYWSLNSIRKFSERKMKRNENWIFKYSFSARNQKCKIAIFFLSLSPIQYCTSALTHLKIAFNGRSVNKGNTWLLFRMNGRRFLVSISHSSKSNYVSERRSAPPPAALYRCSANVK